MTQKKLSIQKFYESSSLLGEKFSYIYDFKQNMDLIKLQIDAIPKIIENYKKIIPKKVKGSEIHIYDRTPELQLIASVHLIVNNFYSASEILALFANKISSGHFPSSFNKIRNNFEKKHLHPKLKNVFDSKNISSYRKIHEIRTEMAHFSCCFIGKKDEEPILIVKAHRRPSDLEEFTKKLDCKFVDFINWTNGAINLLEDFSVFLLENYLIPDFKEHKGKIINEPLQDKNNYPIIKDGLFQVEQITIADKLLRIGIEI